MIMFDFYMTNNFPIPGSLGIGWILHDDWSPGADMQPGIPIRATLHNVHGGPALPTSGNFKYVDDVLCIFSLFHFDITVAAM